MKEVRISDGSSVYGTKACKTCGIIWQRDVNAAKNMLTIANSVWEHNGRPDIFSRHRHNENGAAGSIPTA
ncbi:hypothetical protein BDF20DRAFT_881561 [Mycotypha africana]|uniref:uncharacterized protein n=2 Tax=Mycotypha africana TaxID=64632 RepID=UPI00230023FB|nr:uncharacterized protein BDF20DRAFT_881561 [Mycotypha africana]KAI8973291.1 hypothetical protein BDF20DRAFT_881561 [Mycotypha africana]